jgi:hypothetical protein
MTGSFKIGDRVRLRAGQRYPGYRADDSGTVVAVLPSTGSGGSPLYQVGMDGDEGGLPPAFYADELELVE